MTNKRNLTRENWHKAKKMEPEEKTESFLIAGHDDDIRTNYINEIIDSSFIIIIMMSCRQHGYP